MPIAIKGLGVVVPDPVFDGVDSSSLMNFEALTHYIKRVGEITQRVEEYAAEICGDISRAEVDRVMQPFRKGTEELVKRMQKTVDKFQRTKKIETSSVRMALHGLKLYDKSKFKTVVELDALCMGKVNNRAYVLGAEASVPSCSGTAVPQSVRDWYARTDDGLKEKRVFCQQNMQGSAFAGINKQDVWSVGDKSGAGFEVFMTVGFYVCVAKRDSKVKVITAYGIKVAQKLVAVLSVAYKIAATLYGAVRAVLGAAFQLLMSKVNLAGLLASAGLLTAGTLAAMGLGGLMDAVLPYAESIAAMAPDALGFLAVALVGVAATWHQYSLYGGMSQLTTMAFKALLVLAPVLVAIALALEVAQEPAPWVSPEAVAQARPMARQLAQIIEKEGIPNPLTTPEPVGSLALGSIGPEVTAELEALQSMPVAELGLFVDVFLNWLAGFVRPLLAQLMEATSVASLTAAAGTAATANPAVAGALAAIPAAATVVAPIVARIRRRVGGNEMNAMLEGMDWLDRMDFDPSQPRRG